MYKSVVSSAGFLRHVFAAPEPILSPSGLYCERQKNMENSDMKVDMGIILLGVFERRRGSKAVYASIYLAL